LASEILDELDDLVFADEVFFIGAIATCTISRGKDWMSLIRNFFIT
jgi:hypothetical protein